MPPISRIYLASRSPRRRELLHQIHVNFEMLLFRGGLREDEDVTEDVMAGEDVESYVVRVARAKAEAGVARIPKRGIKALPVLSADTTLELDGEIIGKPENDEHAAEILSRLSGRSHRVLTAVALADGERLECVVNASDVRFRALDDTDIRRYLVSGEHRDKAGAYAVQGRAAMFIEEIRGSYSGIMGLPLFETAQMLKRFGYSL
ncbi:MAG: Maf family protein [Rhodocyclaceae bacterium]|nr:Maf family protein [Rhodocyclaceae bacterium]